MDRNEIETTLRQNPLTARMLGAATLDIATYEEVEHDETATSQAAIVVAIVAVSAAIGGSGGGIGGIVSGLIGAFIGWGVWSGVTYVVGEKLFDGTATWGELLRTIGFAQTPGVFYFLGFIPLLGWMVSAVVWVWMLVTGFVAVRQALDISNLKTAITVVIGWFAYAATMMVLAILMGIGGMLS